MPPGGRGSSNKQRALGSGLGFVVVLVGFSFLGKASQHIRGLRITDSDES